MGNMGGGQKKVGEDSGKAEGKENEESAIVY